MPKKSAAEKVNLTLQYFHRAVSFITTIWDPSQPQMDRELNAQLLAMLMHNSVTVRNECLNNVFIIPGSLTTKSKHLKYLTSAGTIGFPLPAFIQPVHNYDPATADPEIPIPDNIVLNSLIMLKYKADSLNEAELQRHFAILTLAADRIYVAPFLYNFYNNPEAANYNPTLATKLLSTCYQRVLMLGDAYKATSSNVLQCMLRYHYNALIEKTNGMKWDSINLAEAMPLLLQFEQCLNENLAVNSAQAYCLAYLVYRLMPAEIYEPHLGEPPAIKATRLLCQGAKLDDPGCIVHLLYGHRAKAFTITDTQKLEHYLQQACKLTLEDIYYLDDEEINKFLDNLQKKYATHLTRTLEKMAKDEPPHSTKGKNKKESTQQAQIEAQRKADQAALDQKEITQQRHREMMELARAEALQVKAQQAALQAEAQAQQEAKLTELLANPESHCVRIELPISEEIKAAGVISSYRHNPYSLKAF